MPRKPQQTFHATTDEPLRREPSRRSKSDNDIQIERTPVWEQVRDFFRNPTTQIVCGIILLTLALFSLVAYISFFFAGADDQSILSMTRAERLEHRTEFHNVLGLPGAYLSDFLINHTFGLLSLALIALLTMFGLRLVRVYKACRVRHLLLTAFWVIWGSITLGFIQLVTGYEGFFRWGGSHGDMISSWGDSYIQHLGMLMVLIATLVIFLILSDEQFVPRCKQAIEWLKTKTKTKTKDSPDPLKGDETIETAAVQAGENTDTDTTPTIEITLDANDNENANDNDNANIEIKLEVDPQPPSKGDEKQDTGLPTLEITQSETEEIVAEPETADADTSSEDDTLNSSPSQGDGGSTPFSAAAGEAVELNEDDPEYILKTQGPFDPRKDLENYQFPSLSLLKTYENETQPIVDQAEQQANANRIVITLRNYGIEIESIKATVGPTVTLYEVVPKAGTRISKIASLENDIMLALSANGIRIIAPIPGKGAVGIEVPNEKPQTVSMHSVIASKRFQDEQKMRLPVAIGRTITNEVFMFDLAKTPHLLVAGATGQGKSVAINAIITSLLYKKHPAEMKLVMVDPKMVEFAPYKPLLKHYLAAMPDVEPDQVVITECDKVINTLNSLVIEMENRYKLLMDAGVRNLEDYNDKFINRRLNPKKVVADTLHHQYLPYIVIIIDEYGDFIMQAGKQVETPIARITQKARAVGMHMILATQRPSVNIVTGVIKANIPTRIALRTQSVIDSRTVLDAKGADQLIGRGDMLYAGNGNITRIQCAFVDTPEVDQIVSHIHDQQHYFEPYQLPEYVGEGGDEGPAPGSVDMKRLDPMFADVARYVVSKQEGSTSRLQRAFEIGYNRAGKLSDQLEAAGIVGPNKGPKGRDVLIQDMATLEAKLQELGI